MYCIACKIFTTHCAFAALAPQLLFGVEAGIILRRVSECLRRSWLLAEFLLLASRMCATVAATSGFADHVNLCRVGCLSLLQSQTLQPATYTL